MIFADRCRPQTAAAQHYLSLLRVWRAELRELLGYLHANVSRARELLCSNEARI